MDLEPIAHFIGGRDGRQVYTTEQIAERLAAHQGRKVTAAMVRNLVDHRRLKPAGMVGQSKLYLPEQFGLPVEQ